MIVVLSYVSISDVYWRVFFKKYFNKEEMLSDLLFPFQESDLWSKEETGLSMAQP